MRSDGRELLKKNGIRKKVLETKHTSQDVSGRNNYAKTSEHQTDKEDQIRALEAFLQADRRKMKYVLKHLYFSSYFGCNNSFLFLVLLKKWLKKIYQTKISYHI